MKVSKLVLSLVCVAVLGVSCVVVVRTAWAAASRCCNTASSDPGCSGCVSIGSGRHVSAGSHSVKSCQDTPSSQSCAESLAICFELTNVTVYSDVDCTQAVGTVTVSKSVLQCNGADDACSSGS